MNAKSYAADGKPADQVATLGEGARAAPDRISSPEALRSLFSHYKRANVQVAREDARVIAIHRGTPPYDPERLKALGQAWRANLNMREMKGSINNRVDTAYDLHMDLDTRIVVEMRPEFRDPQDPLPALDYGKIIAEEYTFTLNVDWADNYLLIDQVTRDRVKLGLGLASWFDHLDWRPRHVPKLSFFTDTKTPPLPEHLPACCIRDTLRIQDLLHVLGLDKATAETAGWDTRCVRDAVLGFWAKSESNASREPAAVRDAELGSWAAFEQWRASRPSESAVFELENLPVVRGLIRASDSEKVSHYVVADETVNGGADGFLYRKLDQFDSMAQAIWLNPYNYAEGTVGSLSGLGHDLADYSVISNRMVCSALDGGMISGGLLLQAQQGYDADELSVLRIGPGTVVPPSLQVMNSSFAPSVSGILELRSVVRGVIANNVGMTRFSPELMEQASRGTRSAQEVVTERNREFRLETNSANFEYLMWTRFHRETFRRLVSAGKLPASQPGAKEAKAFRKRCLDRGVPEHLLDNHAERLIVEVNRAIGDGSPQSRTRIWGQLLQLRGSMDEAGRRHVEREYASSLLGGRKVDAVFPRWNRDQIPTNEKSIATLENNDFREGSYVPAGSDQIHTLHLGVHFEMLTGMTQAYTENPDQADVQAILATFSAALPHCQEHIQFLSSDETRKDYVEAAVQMLTEFVVFLRNLERDAARTMRERQGMQRERQQGVVDQLKQELGMDAQVKLRKIELDAQLEAMRQQAMAEIRELKAVAQNETRKWSAEARQALDEEMAQRKQALDEYLAERKMALAERTQ